MILHRTTADRRTDRLTLNPVARAAFTLMEMLIVVAIIVALAGLGGYYFLGQLGKSKEKIAESQVKTTLTQAVQSYYLDHSRFPDNLQQLLGRDETGKGPYLTDSDAINDPWGQPYQYNPSGVTETGAAQPEIYTQSPETNRKISNIRQQ
jgi:general secretion pathway protein G